jgi:hypothetical protein
MIQREKELTPKEEHKVAPKEDVSHQDLKVSNALKTPNELNGFPIFPDGTKSLLSKHLSREIWE